MAPKFFGIEHILYLVISSGVASAALLLAKKYCKTDRQIKVFFKCFAALSLVVVVASRFAQALCFGGPRWYMLIPDSYCAMTSLVLALAVLIGNKNNPVLHFVWLLGLFGGVSTAIYATFLGQNPSFFFPPTILGLLHHSLTATLVVALLLFKQIDVTYKKWHYTLFGFTCYITLGAFMMQVFPISDAFHIAEPLIPCTALTSWVMAPMYAAGYALVLWGVEFYKKQKAKKCKSQKGDNV